MLSKIITNELILKTVLEFGRVVAVAVIPTAVAMLEAGHVDLRILAIIAAIAFLKAVDKFLHEVGKAKEAALADPDFESKLTKGLTRF